MKGTEVFDLLGGAASHSSAKLNEVFLKKYHDELDAAFARFHSEKPDGGRDTDTYNKYLEATRMTNSEIREKGMEEYKYVRYEFENRADMNRFINYIRDTENNVPPEVVQKMAVMPTKIHGKWLMELPASVTRRDEDGNEVLDAKGEPVKYDVINVEAAYSEKTGCEVDRYNWRDDYGDAHGGYTQENVADVTYGTLKAEMLGGMGELGLFISKAEHLERYLNAHGDMNQSHALTARLKHDEHGEEVGGNWTGLRGDVKGAKVLNNNVVIMDGRDITNTAVGQNVLRMHEERTSLADSTLDSTIGKFLHLPSTTKRMQKNAQAIHDSALNQTYASGEHTYGRFTHGDATGMIGRHNKETMGIDYLRNRFGEQAIMLRQSAGTVEISDDLMNAFTKMQGSNVKSPLTASQTAVLDSIRERRDKFGDKVDLTFNDKITLVEVLDKMRNEASHSNDFFTEAEETARSVADKRVNDGGEFRLSDEEIKIFGNFNTKRQLDAVRDDLGIDLNFEKNAGRTMAAIQLTHIDPNLLPLLTLTGAVYDETTGQFTKNGSVLDEKAIKKELNNFREKTLEHAELSYKNGVYSKGGVKLSDSETLAELTALNKESGNLLLAKGMTYDEATGHYFRGKKELSDKEAVRIMSERMLDLNDNGKYVSAHLDARLKESGYAIDKDSSFRHVHGADIKREDILKLDRAFLSKAEKAGFNFITAAGTFDVKSLRELAKNSADLKKIGVSRETVETLLRFHENDGGMISQLLHGGSASWGTHNFNLARKGSGALGKGFGLAAGNNKLTGEGDAETAQMMQMVNSYKKAGHHIKQTQAYAKQYASAAKMRIDEFKLKHAKTNKNNSSASAKDKVKQNKAEKRKTDPNAKEKYIANQSKRVKAVSKSEKRWEKVAAAKNKLNVKQRAKEKLAGSALGKAVTKFLTGAKALILKIVGIFLGAYFLIGGAIVGIVVIISMIQALLNLPHDGLKKLYVAAFGEGEPAAIVLYKYMNNELQTTWLESLGDYATMYEDRDDKSMGYTITYTDFSNYINSINGLEERDGDLYINPFYKVGSNVPTDNLTEVECYDGINETQIMANPSVYGEKDGSSQYVSTENGHTCNIKDILAMVDVMYCFDINKFGDGELSDILGEDPAAIDFENFWNNLTGTFKWAGACVKHAWGKVKSFFGFGDDDDEEEFPDIEDYWGSGAVSYATIQNYCGTLFMTSHQRQTNLDVSYYPIEPINVTIDGETKDISKEISQNNASRLHVCNSPVKSKFKIAYNNSAYDFDENKIYPYLLDDAGNIVDLSKTSNSDLPMGLRIHSSTYGHYAGDDEDLCLWDSMAEDMTTYDKIKDMADDSDCWDLTTSKEDYTNYKTTGDWCDTEADAKNNAYGKLWDKKTWLEANPPTVAKEFTLTADHNGFTRVWKEVCWHDEHQYGATEHDKVADGTETAYYYWDGGDKGAGNFGGGYLPLRDEDAGGRRVYYEVRVYEKYSDGSLSSSYDTIYADDTSEASWGGDDGRTLTVTRYNEEDAVRTYDVDKNYTAQWYCPTTELTHYKDIYRCTWTGDLVVQKTEIYNRNCDGHEFEYCGGHVGCHVKGAVYSVTNEQMAMAGVYSSDDILPLAKNFDLKDHGYNTMVGKINARELNELKGEYDNSTASHKYVGAYEASVSCGCVSPLEDIQGSDVNRGLNLYITDGDSLGKDIHCREDVATQTLRDIFDVDCMLDKGSNVFPWKKVPEGKGWKEYEGWTADNMTYVAMRITIDWNDLYGFDIPLEIGAVSLSEDDIKFLEDALAMEYGDKFTDTRKEAVNFALHWISRGHYSTLHKDHDFLDSTCKAHTISRTYNGVTYNISYDACCTASNSAGFVNFYLAHYGKFKMDNYHSYMNKNFTSPSVLLPADTFYRKRNSDEEAAAYDIPWEYEPKYEENGAGLLKPNETTIGDNITDVLYALTDTDMPYGIYIGTLTKIFNDDSYTLPDTIEKSDDGNTITLTNGYKIYKGIPITVTMSLQAREKQVYGIKMTYNNGSGTVYLRTDIPKEDVENGMLPAYYGNTNTTSNYYWFLNPDANTYYRSFE